jgi:hypothetical protein
VENSGKPRFLCLLGPETLLCYYSGGQDCLAMSLLTATAGFGIPEACTCGCGGRGGGSVIYNGGVSSCLLASRSLRLLATIPETSSTSSSSSSGQSAITRRHLLAGSSV